MHPGQAAGSSNRPPLFGDGVKDLECALGIVLEEQNPHPPAGRHIHLDFSQVQRPKRIPLPEQSNSAQHLGAQ